MSRKQRKWLLGELDGLIEAGVLDAAVADRLRRHYSQEDPSESRVRELLLASLGAVLVGGGLILLVAHNWRELSRPVRTVLSFLPLVSAQGLGAYVIWSRRQSPAWRESVGIFWTLAVAVTLALIGQTYQVPGDLEGFLFTWMLLTLPVVYLLNAVLPAAVFMIGVASWASYGEGLDLQAFGPWVLLGLLVPFLLREARRAPFGARGQILGWTLAVCLPWTAGATYLERQDVFWPAILALVFGWQWMEGERLRRKLVSWPISPLSLAGALGVVGQAAVLSFQGFWSGRSSRGLELAEHIREDWPFLLIAAAASLRILWLCFAAAHRGAWAEATLGGWSFLALILVVSWRTDPQEHGLLLAIAVSGFLVLAGILSMAEGLCRGRMGQANAGVAIVALVILLRFFDSDLSLLVRGLAFVGTGVGFLTVNRVLSRRLRRLPGGAA